MTFSLTFAITYGFAIAFIYFSIYRATKVKVEGSEPIGYIETIEIIISNFVPTTLVYVLGCIISNIVDCLFKNNGVLYNNSDKNGYSYNIVTMVFIFFYAIFYCIYMICEFSIAMIIAELLFTLVLLFLNFKSYTEAHNAIVRSIS